MLINLKLLALFHKTFRKIIFIVKLLNNYFYKYNQKNHKSHKILFPKNIEYRKELKMNV